MVGTSTPVSTAAIRLGHSVIDLSPHPSPPTPPAGEDRGEDVLSACRQRLSFCRRQHFGQIIGHCRQARRNFPLGLLRLKQLVRDIEGREDRRFVRLHQRTLAQYLLQCLVEIGGDFPGVLRRQIRPHGVLFTANHDADRMLLCGHLWPPLSRACSSKNVSRCMRSLTRERAPSTRSRSALFSDSRSVFRTGLPRDFSSASAFWARTRQPASSSATSRRVASS